MRLANVLFLYARRLRRQPVQELLAVVGVAVGVALVYAVQVANTSVHGSVSRLDAALAGPSSVEVAARGPSGIDARLAGRIRALPSVRLVTTTIEARAAVVGPRGREPITLIGARGAGGPAQAAATLRRGTVAVADMVAAAVGARPAQRVTLQIRGQGATEAIAAVLHPDDVGAIANGPIVVAPWADAERITGLRGRVSRILVQPRPGREAQTRRALVALAGPAAEVTDTNADARRLGIAARPNDQSTALFSAIGALVGVLFVFNAMLLTMPERRRFIAGMRIEGMNDRTVVALVLVDALAVGVTGSLLGLVLGEVVSREAFVGAPGYLSFAFAVGDERIVTAGTVALAFFGGVAATMLAGLRPLVDLLPRRPLDIVLRAPAEPETPPTGGRWILAAGGALLVIATVLGVTLAPSVAVLATGALAAGMLLMLPALLRGMLRAADALSFRFRSPALVVAVGELRATASRSIALAAIAALAVFGAVAIEGAHRDLQRGLDSGAAAIGEAADLWVMAPGAENQLATIPLRGVPTAAIAAVPGVAAVRDYGGGFLDVGDRRAWVIAPPAAGEPVPRDHVLEGDPGLAERHLRAGGWVALSGAVADDLGVRVGDPVTLPSPVPLHVRVAAIITNLGWGPGALILGARDDARGWPGVAPVAVAVDLRPGADAERVRAGVASAVAASHSGLAVLTGLEREDLFRTWSRQGLSRLTQISTLVLLAAALAMAAAVGATVWQRRTRLATLKLSGFDDAGVWRALMTESALIIVMGCATGAVFGLLGQEVMTRWLSRSTGFPTAYAPAAALAVGIVAAVTALAVLITAVPGRLAARVSPAASFQRD